MDISEVLTKVQGLTLEMCEQILTRDKTFAILGCLVSFALLASALFLVLERKSFFEQNYDFETKCISVFVFGTVVGIGSFIGVLVNASNFISIELAPKVYLLEYFAQLVKAGK